jgi:HAD superfamily hydrolase (TIGR01549 family)
MTPQQTKKTLKVKGVLLDVDGTLYHQAPLRAIIILLLIAHKIFNPLELKRIIKVIVQYRKSQEILRGSSETQNGNQNNQLALTARLSGESVSYVSDIIEEWFEKRPIPFLRICKRRDLETTIDLLDKKGIRLGVFSDYPVKKKLEALRISNFISTVVSSHDERVAGFKPMTNGFKIAAEDMGLAPSDILYVGDRPETDGVGSSEAGMHVIIFRGFSRKNSCEYPSISCFSDLLKAIG